jgi:hypothetical protein
MADPFIDFPYQEPPRVIRRKVEIERQMLSKSALESLINSGAAERELQGFLRRDLSIFGEMYAQPSDDYICFCEFPIADGAVDFALFTGTSRMDVVLVEIKGADFYLVNADSYGAFSQKVNQAAHQIRERLAAVYNGGYDKFRLEMHSIRKKVESGKSTYRSFMGPTKGLGVDPNKDINIWPVVIGGRARDPLEESRKRHQYETHFTPRIKIESWDSWLQKLRRS